MTPPKPATPIIWRLPDAKDIGMREPTLLGSPQPVVEDGRPALRFNGSTDGLVFAQNPIEGCRAFTIEVLFKPDADGPSAQRFVHLEDKGENRVLIETRVTNDGLWYLDTFLFAKPTEKGLTLVNPKQTHRADRWYWAALVYDGKTMSHFVNAEKENSGPIDYGPMTAGHTSVGVRLNKVFWFKGAIAEVRFYPRALELAELQKPK
jgi:hypothetical protein